MILKKVASLTQRFEDPENPLLGPTIKGMYTFGLSQTGTKLEKKHALIHLFSGLFVISQLIDAYIVRHEVNKLLKNISVTALSLVCIMKTFFYILRQSTWRELVKEISLEEIRQKKKKDKIVIKVMTEYTKYTRIITYLYWMVFFLTSLLLVVTPLFIYFSSSTHREGLEPLPQIMCSWFPMDTTKMPGYLISVIVHILMCYQGSGVLAVYDTNAVAIMSYLKGQLTILKKKSRAIFDEVATNEDILDNIKECHRHHCVLIKQFIMFNSLLSPPMFLYVLVCSTTICCSVVQFTSKESTLSQKMCVLEYTMGQVVQLFLFCWHSNEMTVESISVNGGLYASDWWKGDKVTRRVILLLAAKVNYPFILNAGPFTTLSVPTFIDIMKGSYSFYTLFSHVND